MILLFVIVLVLMGSCMGDKPVEPLVGTLSDNTGTVPPETAGLQAVPHALSPVRFASDMNNYVSGRQFWMSSQAGISVEGNSVAITGSDDDAAWVIYSWGGLGTGNMPVSVIPSSDSLATEYWLAFCDFNRESWSFVGPLSVDDTSINIPTGIDCVSETGCFLAAVVVDGGNDLQLAWLNLVTDLESGEIHVDDDAPGPGDGSVTDPFPTVEAGVAAAGDGDTVIIAPGDYTPPDSIMIENDIRIAGAGVAQTAVNGSFLVAQPSGGSPVVVTGLSCNMAIYDPAGGPATTDLQVVNCDMEQFVIMESSGHNLLLHGCNITGSTRLINCSADSTNRIRNCRIDGGVTITNNAGSSIRITGCRLSGVTYATGNGEFFSSNNYIEPEGILLNGDGSPGVQDQHVTDNIFYHCGLMTNVLNVNVSGNRFIADDLDATEILADNPTRIYLNATESLEFTGNTVILPYIPFDGELNNDDGEFRVATLLSNTGVIEDNTFTGGSVCLYCVGGFTSISRNSFTDVHQAVGGAYTSDLVGNSINGCAADAVSASHDIKRVMDNRFNDIGGSCLCIAGAGAPVSAPDLGGGALGSSGGNCFTNFGGFAILMETQAADLPAIQAQDNYWGVGTTELVQEAIWDGADDSSVTSVQFIPFLTEQP